ncbi:hypothetical protein [Nocardioides pantholopis]|uniref:hypothetical protein n=1 Tax=Nocardioides pantholopis TaxID=2483798 RepID=UPI000F073FAC|nr:hypothetical protein [Nocardioides pantholopis]
MSATRLRVSHRRPLAALGAATALVVSGLVAAGAATGAPAAAAPAGDCARAYPVADLAADLAGPGPVDLTGLTVVRDTTPVSFTARAIGIVEDGVAPDVDMVMVDVDLPDVGLGPANQPTGIWQGMSGSPVYAADGRLVGAIAYGMSWGPSQIAGVTPFEAMDEHLAVPAPATVTVPKPVARRLARSGAPALAATPGPVQLSRLDPALSVAGVSAHRLARLQAAKRPWASGTTRLAGRATQAASAASIVAGGNLATSAAYGDVTLGGVGTATSVCEGRVVGFGHPAFLLGATAMALQPAEAVYVQADTAGSPFKVANIGAPVGVITDDRRTGIAGTFGAAPAGLPVTSTVVHGARTRTGRTDVYVAEAAAETAYLQLLGNHDTVLDGDVVGSSLLTWQVAGTDAAGRPFRLGLTNRYAGIDGVDEAAYGISDLVWALDQLDGVTIGSISSTSTISTQRSPLQVARLEQRRAGAWVRVTRAAPVRTRKGRTVRLRVVLQGGGVTRYVPADFKAPSPRYGRRVKVAVTGGTQLGGSTDLESIKAMQRSLAQTVRNDVVRVQLGTADQLRGGGEDYSDEEDYRPGPGGAPRGPKPFVRTRTGAPQPQVVTGQLRVPVRIRR